jgi:phosphoribosylformylglycinamidine synthase
VHLRTETTATPFTGTLERGQVMEVPVAHGDGNYFATPELLRELTDNDQIVFRYCGKDGIGNDNSAPNGATSAIAGVCNRDKTVLGMMPHPENAVADLHATTQGLSLFQSIAKGCLS